METLSSFAPDMEIYSIDEAFLRLDGIGTNPEEYSRTIKAAVMKRTRIPISIGVGLTKTLAKAAARIAKKAPSHGGMFDITGRTDKALEGIDVGISGESEDSMRSFSDATVS
jgi:DNA polymerase V